MAFAFTARRAIRAVQRQGVVTAPTATHATPREHAPTTAASCAGFATLSGHRVWRSLRLRRRDAEESRVRRSGSDPFRWRRHLHRAAAPTRLRAEAEGGVMTNRRLQRTAALAAAVAAVALIPSSARTAPHAPPLIIATPHELRVARPVTSLAADNGRAAFTFCHQLNAVWHPGHTGVVRIGPRHIWS